MGRWSEAPVSNANVEAYFPRGKYKAGVVVIFMT